MSNPAQRLAEGLTRLTLRHVPDSLAIALLLTLIVFVAGATVGGASPMACVRLWGDGFWVLLSFGMQMCVILLSGYLIADSALFRRGLEALVRVGVLSQIEARFIKKDGRRLPILLSRTAVKDEQGEISDIICIAKDMSGYVKADRSAAALAAD